VEHLHQRLAALVAQWRTDGYPCDDYPAIAEILEYAVESESGTLRYLRAPQLHALETYWYLRLVEGTPHIPDLYQKFYPKSDTPALLEALGIPEAAFRSANYSLPTLWKRIKTDDDFVRDFKLHALRETLTLDYPSYILALAMGAGKTVLIGAIIATEFALAMEYPDNDFVENALVFAPGKTILESLRELAAVPYDRILPPRMNKEFAASVKLTFTRDKEADIPVVPGSSFNLVVTNTEKIRIHKAAIPKSFLGQLSITGMEADEAREQVANRRLQAIANLPHLAIFSDEAHHTYGQSLDTGLKRVRQTVDYLHQSTNLVCVINTTGTPYFKRQPLKDVVIWYGLSQGIKDNILKDLAGNIKAYDFDGDARRYVHHVVTDFFRDYGDVRLPNGAPAKLALYFPQTDDLRELKPVVDQALVEVGLSPALCLVNTSDDSLTKPADEDAFKRLEHDPAAPHRVVLLVNKGAEGWNCPSLFSCALARKLRTSNNFVLQAATRCLRQVPGNKLPARVYLSTDNFNVLDRQLQETYGETIRDLDLTAQERVRATITLRKLDIPPLVVTKTVKTFVRKDDVESGLSLSLPASADKGRIEEHTFTLAERRASYGVLHQLGDTVIIESEPDATDPYAAAVELAARHHLDLWTVYAELRRLYATDDIPIFHLQDLAYQIDEQTCSYEEGEEKMDFALALVKPAGFTKGTDESGNEVYTAEIVYPKDREKLLMRWLAKEKQNPADFGFHYDPYNFDSTPETGFFEDLLSHMNLHPDEVEDIYFTGAITDPGKTDFFVEYTDEHGEPRRYTPDFIIRKKPLKGAKPGSGKVLIVEIKDPRFRTHHIDGEDGRKSIALKKWEKLSPDRITYEMIFAAEVAIPADDLAKVKHFVEELVE